MIHVSVTNDGIVPAARFRACAVPHGGSAVVGTAAGDTPEIAQHRALMEAFERTTQFDRVPPGLFIARGNDLTCAVDASRWGLYADAQYARPGFPCARYDSAERRAWVAVRDVANGASRAVPSEFVFPRSAVAHPLVRETSSGTAAAASHEAALETALCELVERDAIMRFWYRHTRAHLMPPTLLDDAGAREDIDGLAERGFVVTIIQLAAAVALPVVAVVAERADGFAFGSAAAADADVAVRHALRECAEGIVCADSRAPAPAEACQVRWPSDHHFLWQREPYRSMHRAFLAATISPPVVAVARKPAAPAGVAALLEAAGYRIFAHTTERRDGDAHAFVVRAIVPGLVPIHFGFGMERLRCVRLSASDETGRLRTLLPHFFA